MGFLVCSPSWASERLWMWVIHQRVARGAPDISSVEQGGREGLHRYAWRRGHPACYEQGRRNINAPPSSSSLLHAVCSAEENKCKEGQNLYRTSSFHLRPTFLDDGGNKTVCWQWESGDRLELWSSAGNAGATVPHGWLRRTDTLQCVRSPQTCAGFCYVLSWWLREKKTTSGPVFEYCSSKILKICIK